MGNIRKHGMKLIEHKIIQKEEQVHKARAMYEKRMDELKALIDERDVLRGQELAAAISKSNKSYEEIMDFINAS